MRDIYLLKLIRQETEREKEKQEDFNGSSLSLSDRFDGVKKETKETQKKKRIRQIMTKIEERELP